MLTALFAAASGQLPQEVDARTYFALTDPEFVAADDRGPWCPQCRRLVHGYGRASLNVQPRFDHFEGAVDCPLSRRNAAAPAAPAIDHSAAQRAMFLASPWFERGFAFLEALLAGDAASEHFWPSDYAKIIARGDAEGIWSQVNLSPWKVPYILATQIDARLHRKGYSYRYVLFNDDAGENALYKCFADSLDRGRVRFVSNPSTRAAVCVRVASDAYDAVVASRKQSARLIGLLQALSRRLTGVEAPHSTSVALST